MELIKLIILALSLTAIYYFIKYLVDSSAAKSIKKLKLKNYSINSSLSKKELKGRKREVELKLKQIEREFSENKINHILHLILSLITAGVWILVWIIIANNVGSKRDRLEKLIDEANLTLVGIEDVLDEME